VRGIQQEKPKEGKDDEKSDNVEITTTERERNEPTNVGKFVHFQRSRSYCVNILCQILNRISPQTIVNMPFLRRCRECGCCERGKQ